MKWLRAAEKGSSDWVHVSVDGIPYKVHSSKAEIEWCGHSQADVHILINDVNHRRLLANKGSVVHREANGWKEESSPKWKVSYDGDSLSMDWMGELAGGKEAAAALTVEAKGERAKIRSLRERLEKEEDPSKIKALSDAIDALETRMEKDEKRREDRRKQKEEKQKAKAAEPKADEAEPKAASLSMTASTPYTEGDEVSIQHIDTIEDEFQPMDNIGGTGTVKETNYNGDPDMYLVDVDGQEMVLHTTQLANNGGERQPEQQQEQPAVEPVAASIRTASRLIRIAAAPELEIEKDEDTGDASHDTEHFVDVEYQDELLSFHMIEQKPGVWHADSAKRLDHQTGKWIDAPEILIQFDEDDALAGLVEAHLGELIEGGYTDEDQAPAEGKSDPEPVDPHKGGHGFNDVIIDHAGRKVKVVVRGFNAETIYQVMAEDPQTDEWVPAPELKQELLADESAKKAIQDKLNKIKGDRGDSKNDGHVNNIDDKRTLNDDEAFNDSRLDGGDGADRGEEGEESKKPGKMKDEEHEEELAGTSSLRTAEDESESDEDDEESEEKEEPKEPKEKKAPAKKEPAKKEPAKKESPAKSDEDKDVSEAEKALKLVEDLLKAEEGEGEGGDHVKNLEIARDMLKKFLGQEENELGDMHKGPAAPMSPKAPSAPMPMKMQILPPEGPMHGGPSAPATSTKPTMMPGKPVASVSPWVFTNTSGFEVQDRVWRKDMVGASEYIGDEPGRIIATAGDKVVVDWGDDVPTEEKPSDLVRAEAAVNERDMFEPLPDYGQMHEQPAPEETSDEEEAKKLLQSMSLRDVMSRGSRTPAQDGDIVHIASGRHGKFVANSTDGRILARFDGDEVTLWPHEIRLADSGTTGLF